MATFKWGAPGTATALTLSSVNSLANGSSSGMMTYDNSTNRDAQASIAVTLGSLTPTTGASITIRVYSCQGATVPDDVSGVSPGTGYPDQYVAPVTTGAGVKIVIFPLVRLYPESLRVQITNNTNVAFAASGNIISVKPYPEDGT